MRTEKADDGVFVLKLLLEDGELLAKGGDGFVLGGDEGIHEGAVVYGLRLHFVFGFLKHLALTFEEPVKVEEVRK
jgi:hypothetical protein